MCDYCDCRTRPLLARLGDDHERIAVLMDRVRAAAGSDERVDRARELRATLDVHSRREEAALYPELALAGVQTDALQAGHTDVDAALQSAARASETEWLQVMAALDRLEDHIYREEYDLFPAAHQVLDDAAWDRIDAAGS